MAGIPAADVVQAGAGVIEGAIGLIGAGKARREAERLQSERPDYQISPLTGEDLSLAKSELASNNSVAEQAYRDLNNSQFSSTIGSVLKSGGTPNSVGAIYGNNQEGRLRLAMMSDQLRLAKINNLVRESQSMQDAQQTKFLLNQYYPWEDKVQANAQARNNAQNLISSGFQTFGAGAMNAANALNEQKQLGNPVITIPNNSTSGISYNSIPDRTFNTSINPDSYRSISPMTPIQYNG